MKAKAVTPRMHHAFIKADAFILPGIPVQLSSHEMMVAQLAAGRSGLVVPLAFDVEWKKPFKSAPPVGELPVDFQAQGPPAKTGLLQAGSSNVPYIWSNAGGPTKRSSVNRRIL